MFSAKLHKANCITLVWSWLAQLYANIFINGSFFGNILHPITRWISVPFVLISWYCANRFIKTCKNNNFRISISSIIVISLMFIMTICGFLILTNIFGLADITFGAFEDNLLAFVHTLMVTIGLFCMVIFGIREAIYSVDQQRAKQ